ncbi:MAG: hypothetical protein HY706_18475 [Candidatus Hydrogenedentes bacterium]|nr:hypothetical protein [Candidatus Hydrogenedentota bacterium]
MSKRNFLRIGTVLLTAAGLVISGCQTAGGSAGLGAALGAGAGAIIGHQSGHAGEGALIGAALGGLTGLVVHDVKARKAREREATAAQYNYQPSQGEMLTFEEASAMPNTVKQGNMVEGSIQYALLGTAQGGATVTETRVLKRGNSVLSEMSSKQFTRTDGTWVSSQQFKVPQNLEPGQYSLVQTVQTAKSRISGTSEFTVAAS